MRRKVVPEAPAETNAIALRVSSPGAVATSQKEGESKIERENDGLVQSRSEALSKGALKAVGGKKQRLRCVPVSHPGRTRGRDWTFRTAEEPPARGAHSGGL